MGDAELEVQVEGVMPGILELFKDSRGGDEMWAMSRGVACCKGTS